MKSALLLSLLPVLASAFDKRNALADDAPEFVLERRDANFGCHWQNSPITGQRYFQCPLPCRLDERVSRDFGKHAEPKHWQCPPTVADGLRRPDELCRWKKTKTLACPANCAWVQDLTGAYEWQCESVSKLRITQSPKATHASLGWRAGSLDGLEVELRSMYLCGKSELACPFRRGIDVGLSLSPTGSFECVNPQEDLLNCGSCSAIPGLGGQDCTRIENAKRSTCERGSCRVLKCKRGYSVSVAGDKCVKIRAPL